MARQHHPAGALYVVATPIGNLADLTLRAVALLEAADCIACEDTRVAAALLRHLELSRPLLPLHAHNEREAAAAVVARLAAGQRVAYVSDAGTPAVSDPGAALVAAVAAAGHRVVPVPGPSSVLAALSVAGDAVAAAAQRPGSGQGAADPAGGGFVFAGFLPAKGAGRERALAQACAEPRSLVLLEAPHRIAALAAALAALAPARTVTLARELTKQFETVATMPAAALPGWLAADANRLRGEFVLVLHARPAAAGPETGDDAALPEPALRTLRALLRELPLKQAVALAAEATGAARNALYAQALRERQADPGAPGDGG